MTVNDAAVIGAFVFMLGLLVLVFLAAGVVHICRDWAEDRARERRYADQWQASHRIHQDRDRYITDRPGSPE